MCMITLIKYLKLLKNKNLWKRRLYLDSDFQGWVAVHLEEREGEYSIECETAWEKACGAGRALKVNNIPWECQFSTMARASGI